MTDFKKRIDRVNEWLHLGGAIPADEYGRLSESGITHIIDVRNDSEVDADLARLQELNIARLQVPVPNFGAPTTEQLGEIVTWLDAQPSKPVVYVHCGSGIGRAATMAVGLLLEDGIDVDAAITQVRAVRPEIRIGEKQLEWLKQVQQTR